LHKTVIVYQLEYYKYLCKNKKELISEFPLFLGWV